MKKNFLAFIFIFLSITVLNGQNLPFFGNIDTIKIISGSGLNQVLIPQVTDSDGSAVQSISFTVLSSDTNLVSFQSYAYSPGESIAIITVKEKGIKGNVKLTIKATDADGTFSRDVQLVVSGYKNPGIKMSFYDIVFWQNAAPDETVASVFDTIINQFDGPFNSINYDKIPLTVGVASGVGKNQFFTATIRGYLTPPVTGDYKFTLSASDNGEFYLSNNANLNNKILRLTDSWDKPDTSTVPISLEAGKVYAIYADLHVINSRILTVLWEGPGIDKQVIPGIYLMPSYDGVAPSMPRNLLVTVRAVNDLILSWTASTDDKRVAGYNVYVDGIKVNSALVQETSYKVSGLAENSYHSIVVQAVDMSGNKSAFSNIINATTYSTDVNPPTPPTTLITIDSTGQAIKIAWSGASDLETSVIGYNIYLDGNRYNSTEPVYADSIIISALNPRTTYNIRIEAVDAAYNVSAMSNIFHSTTGNFDPLGHDLGEKRGRLKIFMNNISWTEGIGLNGPYEDGSMISNVNLSNIVREFHPGVIRWGTLSANPKSFVSSTGPGKSNTYGKMLNFASSIGAYFALTVGVKDGIDYRTNLKYFSHLMDYLGGPDSTYGGALRVAEGYSEPLLQKSKGVLIEFGNEVWGAAAHNAEIGSNYTVYGQWCRDAAAKIKLSPYYDPSKIITAYSGRNPHPDDSYGLTQSELTGDTGNIECLSVSGYLGGNMNYDPNLPMGVSELEYYKYRIGQINRNLDGLIFSMKEMLRLTSSVKSFYMYESNATTPSYNGRLGQAIVMTDYMTSSMKYGSILPTIFTLDGGEWRIIQKENNYKRLPLFITGKYFNLFCKGNILKTQFESTNRLKDGSGAALSLDAVAGSAYCKDSLYSILLISRDFENDYKVQLDLPDDFNHNSSATRYLIHGNDFSTYDAVIDSGTIILTDSLIIDVPKYSMVLITFIGENQHFAVKPLGNFDRIKPTSVTIIPETDTLLKYNGGKLYFKAKVEPANAFSVLATMKLEENSINASWLPFGTGGRYYIKGSSQCSGNGEAVILAYAADDHSVSDRKTVYVINQGLNCPTGITGIEDKTATSIYPNPVSETLYIKNPGIEKGILSVFDLTGRQVIHVTNQNELDVKNLQPGIYIIKIETSAGTRVERFSKE